MKQVIIILATAIFAYAHKVNEPQKSELNRDEQKSHPSFAQYDYMDPYTPKKVNYNPIPHTAYSYEPHHNVRPTFYPVRPKPVVEKPYIKPEYEASLKPHHGAIVSSYFRQGYASDGKQMDYKTHYDVSPPHYAPYHSDYPHPVYNKPLIVNDYRKARPYVQEFVPAPYYSHPTYVHPAPYVFRPNQEYDYSTDRNEQASQVKKRKIYETTRTDNRSPLSIYGY